MDNEKIIEGTKQFNELFKIDKFKVVLEKLTTDKDINENEKAFILSCAIFFLDGYNKDKRYRSFLNFGYYIILKYSIKYKDFKPLFDFSLNFGFYPISKFLLSLGLIEEESINDILIDAGLDNYYNGDYYETFEQKKNRIALISDISLEKGYIAPTSYGKSSVIIEIIKNSTKEKIAIIVPTKSLLVQTYKNIKKEKFNYKLLVHDEMFENENTFIAIFTQERALRLLSKGKTFFDLIFIDEAHNILKNNSRSILISRLISQSKKLNSDCEIIYLSPLVEDIKNIKVKEDQEIKKFTINFNIKEPEIYELKLNKEVYKHNRFFLKKNEDGDNYQGFKLGIANDKLDYVISTSKNKNFLYTFRPMYIEKLARDLSKKITPTTSEKLNEIIKILKQEVHPEFYGVALLKFGIVYLHGKIPDIIKEYLESKIKEINEIKFIVANNVILEGINLPVDSLYIFSTYSLQGKELTNLIGRVNRLSDIFNNDKNNIEKLLPNIHFVNNNEGEYSNGNNMFNKILLLRNSYFKDEVKNPVLSNFDINSIKDIDKVKQEKRRKEVSDLIIREKSLFDSPLDFNDRLYKSLFESGIAELYNNSEILFQKLKSFFETNYYETNEWKEKDILDRIKMLFLFDSNIISDEEFRRLTNDETVSFYRNYIRISQKRSLKENIDNYFKFYKERSLSNDFKKRKFYFGTSYGDEVYDSVNYPNSKRRVYVDLGKVNDDVRLLNLVIVKLKMEDEFVSFTLNKFIVFLHDFNLITDEEYNIYVYGTTDKKKIKFTKFGLNIGLITKLERDDQLKNIYFDSNNNIKYREQFKEYLFSLNDFQRFEIEKFI